MSHLGTCRWRSAVVEACDLRCRRPPQGLQRNCTGIFSSSGVGCGDAKRAREGPASRTALAADVSHSREPARALGSEYGVDADAFTECSSLHSAYCWAGTAPDVVSCVRQSPMNAGPAVAHPMPSTPAPLPAIPAAFVSHRPDKFCHSPGALVSCLFLRREQVLVLGVGEGRGGLGWAGLGWLGWAAGAAPSCLF